MLTSKTLQALLSSRDGQTLDDNAWQELAGMLDLDGEALQRLDQSGDLDLDSAAPRRLDPSGGRIGVALARRAFVGGLAEWVQMHDYHARVAIGPPAKASHVPRL